MKDTFQQSSFRREYLNFHLSKRNEPKLAGYQIACSKCSDSGERCEVKKAMKSRGGLGREVRGSLSHLSPSLSFIFSRSFLLCSAPHHLNAWNRLGTKASNAHDAVPMFCEHPLKILKAKTMKFWYKEGQLVSVPKGQCMDRLSKEYKRR